MTAKIKKQIQTFVKENNYTYSGIRKALIYFYEIKNGNVERANGGLGIVPYIYCEARDYYKGIWEANQRNNKILIQNPNFTIQTKTIKINAPKRELKKQHLFTFLDEEETK